MVTKQSKPAWWILYVLVALMVVGLTLESTDGLPEWANEVASIGIVLMVFGGMFLWVWLNSANLWHEELHHNDIREYTIVEYSPQETQLGRSNGHGNSTMVSVDEPSYSAKD